MGKECTVFDHTSPPEVGGGGGAAVLRLGRPGVSQRELRRILRRRPRPSFSPAVPFRGLVLRESKGSNSS